ncbi:hypothetical protein DIPPA_33024 [Diplonema papillatum]|nr:hypothetical protein DIPPA_33024 [Diplonema papillatum]
MGHGSHGSCPSVWDMPEKARFRHFVGGYPVLNHPVRKLKTHLGLFAIGFSVAVVVANLEGISHNRYGMFKIRDAGDYHCQGGHAHGEH